MALETNIKVYDEKSLPYKPGLFPPWDRVYQHTIKDSKARLIRDFREAPEGEIIRLSLGTANNQVFDEISDLLGEQITQKNLSVKAIMSNVISVDEKGDNGLLHLVNTGAVNLYHVSFMVVTDHYQSFGRRKIWQEEPHNYDDSPRWGQYFFDGLIISLNIHSFDATISPLNLKPIKNIEGSGIRKMTNKEIWVESERYVKNWAREIIRLYFLAVCILKE